MNITIQADNDHLLLKAGFEIFWAMGRLKVIPDVANFRESGWFREGQFSVCASLDTPHTEWDKLLKVLKPSLYEFRKLGAIVTYS
jgi:hypothetical protein